jgi:hypothetical protein
MKYGTLAAAVALGLVASNASAQQVTTQPINPTAAVVPVADTTASLVGGGIRGLGRAVAGTLEDNAIVRVLNRLLGRTVNTNLTQAGYSALPVPTSYQSTAYPNSFRPTAPVMSTFGQSPTGIFPKK